jgi:hypothetical protein
MQHGEHDAHARESARLRYELGRLRDRRTVRAALAVGDLRRGGPGAALAALRGRAPRMDVPGPQHTPLRPPFPHLRVLHTGEGHLVASTGVHERLTPATGRALLQRDRPDLLLIDGVVGWSGPALATLREAARVSQVPVVTLGPTAAAAVPSADLRVAADMPVADAQLDLGVGVDIRMWSPTGLDDATPAHRRDDVSALQPTDARRQPVVVVPDVAAVGARRCVELLSAGALVVTGPDPRLRDALAPLGTEVVGSTASIEQRAAALLADDAMRRRLSVRLRRHVHARLSTRGQLIALVEALHLDDRPSQRISVLLATRRPDRVQQVLQDLDAQRHPDMEVILLPHGDAPLPDRLPTGTKVQRVPAERPLGAVLNVGLDLATGAYVAKVDDDDRYGTDHLGDQVLAVQHSGAELVGRRSHGVYDEVADVTIVPLPGGEERFEDHLPGGTLLAPAAVMRALRWRHVPRAVDTELVRAVHLAGGSAYSSHAYGYVRVRHGDHLYDPSVDWPGARVPGFDTGLLEA